MGNSILKALSNNLGFKILSILFAIILWLTVYNLEDPTKTMTYTISVTVENRDYVSELGKYFELEEGSQKISFSVQAARSVLDKLDASDFVAVADMNYINIDDGGASGSVPVELACTANISNNAIKLSSTTKTAKVRLEDLMTKQFVVSAKTTGTPTAGFAVGDIEVTAPNVVKVSGPKSVVETVSSITARVNVTGMSSSGTHKATPILLNKSGKEVDTTRLTLDNAYVNVYTEILKTKDVAISVEPQGTPANGYVVTAITSDPTTVKLKGKTDALNGINIIEIPSELLSIAGEKEDVTAKIDITEYLPEGVQVVDVKDASVEITVSIKKIKTKAFTVKTEDVVVTGLPKDWKCEYELDSFAVNISGLESDISLLTKGSVTGSIDVTGLKEGSHKVTMKLDLNENKYEYADVEINITLTAPQESTEGE